MAQHEPSRHDAVIIGRFRLSNRSKQAVLLHDLAQQWQVESQYRTLHLTHRGALWASGAAQAAQFVRIILRFCGELWVQSLTQSKPVFFTEPDAAASRRDVRASRLQRIEKSARGARVGTG